MNINFFLMSMSTYYLEFGVIFFSLEWITFDLVTSKFLFVCLFSHSQHWWWVFTMSLSFLCICGHGAPCWGLRWRLTAL